MNETQKSLFLWGGITLVIIVVVALLATLGNGSTPGTSISLNNTVSDNDNIKGASDAAVSIVEYSDFQCPGCASSYPMLKQLVEDYPDDVSLAYRHYPLTQIHAHAQLAGQAAEAAARQNNFWEMHDVLFNTQTQWSHMEDPTEFFTSLAESIGLNVDQFVTDLSSQSAQDNVEHDRADAAKLNLPGTPSFFINGTLIEHPGSYDGFKSLVEAELAK